MHTLSLTFDVEPDLHSGKYLGIIEGIPQILSILDKHNIKATFFTTCDCIEKYPEIFQNLKKQGHEIALHGYRHIRFDELSLQEKEEQMKKSVACFQKYFGENPKGFRAPQHSINYSTLRILSKYKIKYDSSHTPLNLLQLIFFPKKFALWIKGFFTPRKKYEILKEFYEIPVSSFLMPFVSLPLRMFPGRVLKIYLWVLKKNYKNLVFYAHSWDFIELPKSKINKMFNYRKLIKNLEKMINYFSKQSKFVKIEELI